MIKLTIDGQEAITRDGEDKTLLQLAQSLGIKIPTLCYHPSLEPSGGCRLCLVEITKPSWEGWSKLVVSCAYPAEDGIIVKTNSESAKGVLVKVINSFVMSVLVNVNISLFQVEEVPDPPPPPITATSPFF